MLCLDGCTDNWGHCCLATYGMAGGVAVAMAGKGGAG